MQSAAKRRVLALAALSVALSTTLSSVAHAADANSDAQRYPTKPIRLIVAYSPGGMADNVARALAVGLAKELGQPVIIENRGGAGGTIGAAAVAKAAPDGYTLNVSGPPQIAVAPLMLPHRPYDSAKDFTPIATFITVPDLLLVNPSVPAKNLAELIAYTKGAGQGKMSFGVGGPGSSGQLHGQALNEATGMQMTEVPYGSSSSAAFPDLISGRVQATYTQVTGSLGFVRAGQVRPIVVLSEKRSPLLPDVPTVSEAGYPSATMEMWQGIEGPAGMPPAIVAKLSAAIRTVMASPSVRKNMEEIGAEPYVTSPEEFRAVRERDIARFTQLVKDLKLGEPQ